ncbi:MAG TPA: hypothetical protein VLJ39_14820, partial [Tepidisphaeraceae bacterium]|nr:hypothetical protein [Tepidisphaeraceae bacterium]
MTVVSTPLPAGIRRYLADFVARARRLALARAVALGVCAFAGWMLLWCGVDRFAHLPSAFRLVVLALGVAFLVFRSVPTLLAFYRKMDWVTTAAEVERHNPQFAQRLVTVTSRLLGAADYRGSDEILSRLLREVDQEVTSDRPARLLPLRPAVGPFALAAILLLFIIALLQVPDLRFGALVRRFLDPMAAIPPVTTTRLVVSPGDLALVQSQPLTIEVTARNLGDSPVRLYVNEEDRDWTRIVMTPSGSGQYSFTLPAVDRDLRYHVEGGDARTDDYQVRVLRRPAVAQFRIRYDYPAYTHLAPNTVTNTGGRIEAPGGTHVSLTVVATEPLQAALLTIGSDRVLMDRTADPTIRHADLVVRSDAKYSLDLISTRDVAGTGPAGMSIRSIPDLPPQVRLARAGDVLRLNPRDIVPVLYEALDDYGLKSLALRAQINNHDPVELPIRLWRDPRRQQDVFNLDLATLPLGMGDQVKVWAVATDTAGHTAQGAPLQVVISPRSVDLDAYQRISELHSASQLVQTLVSQLDEGVKAQADIQAPHDALSQAYLSATSRADRAISAASQTATLLRQSLLRAVTHSHSPLLCVSLAEWIDLAETEAAAADEAFRQSGAPGALSDVQRDRLKSALDRIRQMQPRLTAVERGEQAAAVLADDENLLATQKRPAPKDEPGRRRLRETIQRMRQDLSAE